MHKTKLFFYIIYFSGFSKKACAKIDLINLIYNQNSVRRISLHRFHNQKIFNTNYTQINDCFVLKLLYYT